MQRKRIQENFFDLLNIPAQNTVKVQNQQNPLFQNQCNNQNVQNQKIVYVDTPYQKPVSGFLLQKKWEDLMDYMISQIMRHLRKFNRNHVGSRLVDIVWETEQKIILASLDKKRRIEYIKEVDIDAKLLQRLIAQTERLKIIDSKKYKILSKMLVEIGKIIGGLLRSPKCQ